jgi:DNA (cytosine-5)-methyltransferase 1
MLRIAEGLRKFHGEKFVIDFLGSDDPAAHYRIIGTDKPITTQHCSNRYGLATPFIIDFLRNGKVKGVGEPINTQHCKDRFGVATPFIVKGETGSKPSSMEEPISTQTSFGKFTLCTPIIVDFANGGRVRGAGEPMPTLTAKNSMCVATPIIYDYGNGGKVKSADDPMPTQTTRGNMSVAFPVTSEGRLLDVCFRMLSPNELKMATGFPRDYVLTGTKTEMIKQIGNAVPVNTARELVKAALTA